jgi:hypothetical protein
MRATPKNMTPTPRTASAPVTSEMAECCRVIQQSRALNISLRGLMAPLSQCGLAAVNVPKRIRE